MTVAEAWAKVRKSVEFHAPHLDPEVAVVAQALERPMTPEIRAAVERLRAFHEASVAHRVYHDTGQCYGDSHAIHEVTRRDFAEWLESGGAGLLADAADAGARALTQLAQWPEVADRMRRDALATATARVRALEAAGGELLAVMRTSAEEEQALWFDADAAERCDAACDELEALLRHGRRVGRDGR